MITYKEAPDNPEVVKELLIPLVRTWFFNKFKDFSLPQLFGVSEVHKRQNILVSAPTGTGKTLTSFLAILNELIDLSQKNILENKIYCVYISPLKALNNDIKINLLTPLEEIEKIAGKKLGIRVAVRTGDTTVAERAKMLKTPPHILITTPESLALILSSSKFVNNLKNTDYVIIDEVHSLAENKRGVHLSLSLERLQALSPGICRLGLSATIAPLTEIAKFLVGTNRYCKIIDISGIKKMDLKVLTPSNNLIDTTFESLSNDMYTLIDSLIQQHKTTLIFTNTRAGTERVVHHLKERFPKNYVAIEESTKKQISLIGAHHGSLSKEHRFQIEDDLRKGKLKACVSSTSLELGIDIGFIDLVICLGSPKSVARLLQRQGRAGHKLHDTTKGRLIVLDRDDLVECSVMLKLAIERKIDKVHIPTNCLDVLAQQIIGITLNEPIGVEELYLMIKQSYCYKDLSKYDFLEIIKYLAGEYTTLEDRHVYARIWFNEGKVGRRGRMAKVIYMTNIGTIPDQTSVKVKHKNNLIGTIDEGFLEKLERGDIFVLGGNTYQFLFARGMSAEVIPVPGKLPTVPSWFSEMLPLSFDLALEIQRFRKLVSERMKKPKREVLDFIKQHLYLEEETALAIYEYFLEQYQFLEIPTEKKLIIEEYKDENDKIFVILHSLFGRRVNDCLSRCIAYIILRTQHIDVEVGISDNGFYLSGRKPIKILKALRILKSENIKTIAEKSIDKSEILKRRFRHCAGRAYMILREYKGVRKYVGRQQVSSMILMSAVKRISNDFPILKEARREVLEDLMDLQNATLILKQIEENKLEIKEKFTLIPSPFALNLVSQGMSDILKAESKQEFLKRMHKMVLAKINLKK